MAPRWRSFTAPLFLIPTLRQFVYTRVFRSSLQLLLLHTVHVRMALVLFNSIYPVSRSERGQTYNIKTNIKGYWLLFYRDNNKRLEVFHKFLITLNLVHRDALKVSPFVRQVKVINPTIMLVVATKIKESPVFCA